MLIDTDPGFTQIRHLTDPAQHAQAAAHTAHFSFGECIGRMDCTVPDDGYRWRPTRQPVVLDLWPVTPPPASAPFTTVMSWESYPARDHAGVRLGMKAESFTQFRDMPVMTRAPLELALGGANAPRSELRARGWRIADPLEVARHPWDFQDYLHNSAGEFSVAKHGYVVTRSGWFGERSAGYLASGRPVLLEDTGFSSILPVGEGLFAFSTTDGACRALRAVEANPARHQRAARELAAACFDHGVVLCRLLDEATEG